MISQSMLHWLGSTLGYYCIGFDRGARQSTFATYEEWSNPAYGLGYEAGQMHRPFREDHCTHPKQAWCDCDWCRINNHWHKS